MSVGRPTRVHCGAAAGAGVSSEVIYAPADSNRAGDESAAWDQFSSSSSTAEFCGSWLVILCGQIQGVSGALLVLGPDQAGGYSAAAVWPDASRNMKYLGSAAEKALSERRGFVERVFKERRQSEARVLSERRTIVQAPGPGQQSSYVGYPIEVSGVLFGAVILDIDNVPEQKLQHALRLVHWGSAWLIDRFRQQQFAEQGQRASGLALASEVVATALQESRLGAAALAVANELTTRLSCERVGIGLEVHGNVVLQAISHTASFDARSDFIRLIGEAMDEVLDLDMPIVHPALDDDAVGGLAHAELSSARGEACIMSVPLVDDGELVGVITFERVRDKPFERTELELCKTLGMLLGPILALKQRGELGFFQRASQALHGATTALFGPSHPGLKLVSLVSVLAIMLLSVITSSYRVASKTVIEGSVQRAVVAPFQGYVAESFARAGDIVKAGQTLAKLDDRELKLERARWASEAQQMQGRYRQAAAEQERVAMAVAAAQGEQALAQQALVDERLARATLTAPFDGIVVQGDLSQLLGSPVELGKVLFEVAPLDVYRVVLNVDERDIAQIRAGQRGELALSGMPYDRPFFTVRQVTPISTPQDGRNYFRVEAELDQASPRLRPGMEGIGKVQVGERKLIWIWTHSLFDWLRLWTWKWLD
jgi:multidrug resistance efflux pump